MQWTNVHDLANFVAQGPTIRTQGKRTCVWAAIGVGSVLNPLWFGQSGCGQPLHHFGIHPFVDHLEDKDFCGSCQCWEGFGSSHNHICIYIYLYMCVCVSCLLGMMVPMIHKSMAAGSEFLVGALLKPRPGQAASQAGFSNHCSTTTLLEAGDHAQM